jgi:hypothetical protein
MVGGGYRAAAAVTEVAGLGPLWECGEEGFRDQGVGPAAPVGPVGPLWRVRGCSGWGSGCGNRSASLDVAMYNCGPSRVARDSE